MHQVEAQPGYVRLVIGALDARAMRACREFAALCTAESASCALVLARSAPRANAEFDLHLEAAARALPSGFRLAVVASGAETGDIARAAAAMAARRRGQARIFRSEHRAAAWLMG